MAQPLYLIATIRPIPEHRNALIQECKKLVEASLQESGCELYDLVIAEGDDYFTMMEKWTTKAHWDDHMLTAHVAAMGEAEKKYCLEPNQLKFLLPAY